MNYFFILVIISNFVIINSSLADNMQNANAGVNAAYKNFIKPGALKPYKQNNRRLKVAAKFKANPDRVNSYRKRAAYMAIDSGKCDAVTSSDIVGEKYLEYEVICQNGAIIYLTEHDIKLRTSASDPVISEKEKALPRGIAKSRCEQLINNYVFNQNVLKDQLEIDRYKIATWITELGETGVRMSFMMNVDALKGKQYTANCIFRHNEKVMFEVKSSQE